MNRLVCPACGARIQTACLTSNPPQYEAECTSQCGFQLRWFSRVDPFAQITQRELWRRCEPFDLLTHLRRQNAFSIKTFGPGYRDEGIVDHISKELKEILAAPGDLEEWIDVLILALDGAQRNGHSPTAIIEALVAKQEKNEGRDWPDWRTAEPGKAIEHVRTCPHNFCRVGPGSDLEECSKCGQRR